MYDKELSKVHTESDTPNAMSEYGKYKAECEKIILNGLGENAIILRPSFIMGRNCRRSEALLRTVESGEVLDIAGNIEFNYTPVIQIAECLWYILENDLSGIFQVGTKDTCEYSEFIKQLTQAIDIPKPELEIEYMEEKSYQAVIPAREEIPDEMQMKIENAIMYLKRVLEIH